MTTTVGPLLSGLELSNEGRVPEVTVDMMMCSWCDKVNVELQNDNCRKASRKEVRDAEFVAWYSHTLSFKA
jgi:hypothetical protein